MLFFIKENPILKAMCEIKWHVGREQAAYIIS